MKRYQGIEVIDADETADGLYYLVRVEHLTKGWERHELRTEPGRTNMSRREKIRGWLGTTNDVAQYADGCVRVSRASGRLRIAPVDPAKLRAAEECGS